MKTTFLDFEQPISELETKIEELRFVQNDSAVDISEEIDRLKKKSEGLTKEIYAKLSPWQVSQVERHPQRPYTLDYIREICTDFHELHGDRAFADDRSIVGGVARFNGQAVMVIGHQKGIEGLVHVSEMDWTNKNVAPNKIVQLGDEVEVMVLEIDEERRRISLGMKQCKPNPWEEFSTHHKKGDKLKGAIKSITDFGVFIGLDGGIDGLVHLSDLSWNESGEEAVRKFKKGDELEAVVLAIDVERERISLGVKQLEGDPFNNFVAGHDKGAVVTGVVKSVDAKGATIDLGDEIEAYLRASEISRDKVEDARNVLKEGDSVNAIILNVDRKTRSIQLSIKAKDNADTAEAMQKMQETGAASGTTNLGALLKAKMNESK